MTVRERAVAAHEGPSPRPPSVLVAVLWAVTVVAAGATAVGFASWLGWAADLLAAFRPYYAVVALVCLVGMALAGRAMGVVLAAGVVAVNAMVIAPLWLATPPPPPEGAPSLTVLWHNVNAVGARRTLELASEITEAEADVAILMRVNPGLAQALSESAAQPLRVAYYAPESRIMVLARVPITGARPVGSLPAGSRGTAVAFDAELAPGRTVGILGLHTQSPRTPRRAAVRDAELAVAASWAATQDGPTLLVGDLNTPPWSHQLRTLASAGGLHDSLRGHGLQPTWPSAWGPVGVPIDHALHSPDLAVVERATGPAVGSRHRSIRVTVTPTEPVPGRNRSR